MKTYILFLFVVLSISFNTLLAAENKSGSRAVTDSLTNIGHATMKIKTGDGKVIYIDPFQPGDYSDSADIILVTHAHGDHNNGSLVKQKPGCTIITYSIANLNGNLQSFTVDNIHIDAVPAYNQNHNKLQCVGYVLEFNNIRLYHAGDTGPIPEMTDLASRDITYALLPVDGIFTMSPDSATVAANWIQADFNIPMHTEPPPDNYNEDNADAFAPPNKILVRHGETIALLPSSTDVDSEKHLPLNFQLRQNYPNPFNPSTTISFTIPKASPVSLKIFDINGSEVAILISEVLSAGDHSIQWYADGMPSGIYFCQIESGGLKATRKFVLMK